MQPTITQTIGTRFNNLFKDPWLMKESFLIICIRLHIWRNIWPFLHADIFRIIDSLGIVLKTTGFLVGFKSGDCHCRTWTLFYWTISVRIFESLSCWTIYLRPRLSFLAEATRFSAKISWYFVEWIVSLILNGAPGSLASKWYPKHQWPTTIFDRRVWSANPRVCISHLPVKHVNDVYGQNIQFWCHLTIALSSLS